jgi:2-aminoadipate transaminase
MIMPTVPSLSTLSSRLIPSSIRRLEQIAATTPGLISLGPGQPDDSVFPAARIAFLLQSTFHDPLKSAQTLQYGPSKGDPALIDQLVRYMCGQGVICDASNILITSGAQQGFDLVSQLLVDRDDIVLVQPETYPGALQVLNARGAKVMSTDEASSLSPSVTPKFIYAMSDFQNPRGDRLSVQARIELVEMARRHNTFLIEDGPYREINFTDNDVLPTLLETDCGDGSPDDGRTLFLGSFSKMVSPGLRIGWIVGPAQIISQLTVLRQSCDLQPSTLSQTILAALLSEGIDHHLTNVRHRYKTRRDSMLAALQTHMAPYGKWNTPDGGFFVWLELEGAIDTAVLLESAIEQLVAYVPGSAFNHNGKRSSELRLSFSSVEPEHMDEAIRRLSVAIAQYRND